MTDKLKYFIKLFIGWPLSVIAVIFISKFFLSSKNLYSQIHNIDFATLILAVFSFFLYFLFRALFWHKLLEFKNHKLTIKESTLLWSLSELKRYIPGNIWSFIGRADAFSKKGVPVKISIISLYTEAQFLILSSFIWTLFSLNLLFFKIIKVSVHFYYLEPLVISFTFLITIIFLTNPFKKVKNKIFSKINNFISSPLNLYQNIFLFSFMMVAMFFFGLGTYFSVISFFTIPLNLMYVFIGFFVFSFIAGYLSLITPMGLGVREGIMVLGLSKYISLAGASFSSIFSRFILILSELIFLFLLIFWNFLKERFIKLEHLIANHKQEALLALFILVYIIYFTTASFLRYQNFYTGRFDLGNMDQTVWNTIHGRIFQLTDPDGTNIVSRLSYHADFILVLISPLYLIWQDPRMLLLLQTVVLGFGALFVYLIAKDLLESKNLSLIFAFSYLIYPEVGYTNLYDFHGVSLATTFLLAGFYFVRKKKTIITLLFLILAGLTKEDIWLIVGFFGIYISLARKKIILGILIFLLSITLALLLVLKFIPQVRGSDHFALSYYSDFGSSPISILKGILFSPVKTLSVVFRNYNIEYLFELFGPLGLLSLISPVFLLFIVPDLAINLLSQNSTLHEIYYQYTAAITPFVFISAIYSARFVLNKFKNDTVRRTLSFYVLIAALVSAYILGPLPGTLRSNIDMFTKPLPNAQIIDNFISRIPKRLSVAASNNIGSHLSHRQYIYTIPVGLEQADVVLFLLNDQFAQPSLSAQKQMVDNLRKDKRYIKLFENGDFIAFRRIPYILY